MAISMTRSCAAPLLPSLLPILLAPLIYTRRAPLQLSLPNPLHARHSLPSWMIQSVCVVAVSGLRLSWALERVLNLDRPTALNLPDRLVLGPAAGRATTTAYSAMVSPFASILLSVSRIFRCWQAELAPWNTCSLLFKKSTRDIVTLIWLCYVLSLL